MHFGGTLYRIIRRILTPDLQLEFLYLVKVDLVDAYMQLWVQVEDTYSIAFLVSKKEYTNEKLVSFHLSLHMVFL